MSSITIFMQPKLGCDFSLAYSVCLFVSCFFFTIPFYLLACELLYFDSNSTSNVMLPVLFLDLMFLFIAS
jgi:hypothetical protein